MLWACFSLGGMAAFLCRMRLLPGGLAPLGSLCLMALCLTAAGMAGVFSQGRLLFIAAGCLAGVMALLPLSGKHLSPRVPSPPPAEYLPCAAFFCALLLTAWYYQGIRLAYWDEFYWGGFAKALVHENGLWTWDTPLPRRDSVLLYPPLLTVLHAFFMPHPQVMESGVALGGMAFALAVGCVVFHYCRRRVPAVPAAALGLLAVCLVRTMGTKVNLGYYLVGYAETTQAALFTALACIALFETRPSPRRRILWPGLMALAWCKPTGILLAFCIIGVAAVYTWLTSSAGVRLRRTGQTVAVLCTAPLAAWLIWKIHLDTAIFVPAGGHFTSLPLQLTAERVAAALWAFAHAFAERSLLSLPSLGERPYTTSCVALLALMVLSYLAARKHGLRIPQKHLAGLALLFLGLWGWLFAHLAASTLYFTNEEVMRAASFERYTGAYMACLCVIWTIVLLYASTRRRTPLSATARKIIYCGIGAIFLACLLPLERPAPSSRTPMRTEMEGAAAVLRQYTPAGSLFWFVMPGITGQEILTFNFLNLPQRKQATVTEQLSFYQVEAPEAALAAGELPPNLRALAQMRKPDYLLIWMYDSAFAQKYAELLGLKKDARITLLRLVEWRQGLTDIPEVVFTCP